MPISSELHAHYSQLLGLVPPWTVVTVDLNVAEKRVTLDVQWESGHAVACPTCGAMCSIKDRREARQWRHLDTMQFQTIITSRVPRSDCPEHGAHTIAVPWAGKHSRFTLLFERFAIEVMLAAKNLTEAGQLLGLSWDQVQLLQARAVDRGVRRRTVDQMPYVGMDEKSFLRGHQYASLMVDITGRRVVEVVPERTLAAAETLWTALPAVARQGVHAVAMDMWEPYRIAASTHVPQADIVHDKFHIAKYLGEAVDKVRRAEHKTLRQQGNETLTRTKYLFLTNPENMTDEQRDRFDALRLDTLKAGRAWAIKEAFANFWTYTYAGSATKFFDRWYWWATHSRLPPIIAVAKLLKRHVAHLLTYLRHRITNALMEGFNAKIQSIKANARGYRTFANYRCAILFSCGKLDLYP